jgi:hypothetical protein
MDVINEEKEERNRCYSFILFWIQHGTSIYRYFKYVGNYIEGRGAIFPSFRIPYDTFRIYDYKNII